MQKLTIATRGSRLALWQAEYIKSRLQLRHPGLEVDLLVLKTKGDVVLDTPLAKIGGKGLFVKEIEEALLDGRADLAVHSMKDVPMQLPGGLKLGAIPEREDPADIFMSVNFGSLDELPQRAKVGTSSLRRTAQLLALRPDLRVESLRGNVDTRLRKLMEWRFDAIVMAAAGINRLGISAPKQKVFSLDEFLPSPGQGALGLEYAVDRPDVAEIVAFLDHRPTRVCVEAERSFLSTLEGGCQTPIGAYATLDEQGMINLTGMVASLDGTRIIRQQLSSPVDDTRDVGYHLAWSIMDGGGSDILREIYAAQQ